MIESLCDLIDREDCWADEDPDRLQLIMLMRETCEAMKAYKREPTLENEFAVYQAKADMEAMMERVRDDLADDERLSFMLLYTKRLAFGIDEIGRERRRNQ